MINSPSIPYLSTVLLLALQESTGFLIRTNNYSVKPHFLTDQQHGQSQHRQSRMIPLSLFGRSVISDSVRSQHDSYDEENESAVTIRVEKTSFSSRRIGGDITVPAPLKDVWAILTDYNRLATHVPNLIKSQVIRNFTPNHEQGDGEFRCKLYQEGAQNIAGFGFSASVTMDMTEKILKSVSQSVLSSSSLPYSKKTAERSKEEQLILDGRSIGFKCAESSFFSKFDGEWKIQEQINSHGEIETSITYLVDVKPKGPVPIAALEWRIRKDVPINLLAVKKAAMMLSETRVLALC